MSDDKPRVTGIGGVFFKSANPKNSKQWYKENLGFVVDQWGTNFEWYQGRNPSKKGYTQWSPFPHDTDYFQPSSQPYMINYRVVHLEKLLQTLAENGVTILDEIQEFDYGKFVHILDNEGNKIELWEPNDAEYEKGVQGRTG